MKIIGIIFGSIACIIFALLVFIGSVAPETSVYVGRQVPKRYVSTIRSLNLLEKDEKIKYFYSDAIFDIKEGFYMVTDRNLVVYSKEWETPAEVTPLKDIVALDVDYDESFFEDSMVVVETIEGMEVTFPLSSEKGLDKKFVEAIRAKMPKVEPQEVEETSPPNELKAAS